MTFLEMQDEVFLRLAENSSSPTFWSRDEVKAALNDGYEEISDATEWYERNQVINLLSNRTYYDLRSVLSADTFLTPKRCLNSQTDRWLTPTSIRDMDTQLYRRWEVITVTEPERMFQRGLWWLGVFPQKGADSGTLRFYFTAIPPPLSADGDEPGFPEEFHYGLIEYAIGDLLGQEAESGKAIGKWGEYLGFEAGLGSYVDGRISLDRVTTLRG